MRWQKIIEGAILSDDDITDDVTLKDFGKILGGLKLPSPPANALPVYYQVVALSKKSTSIVDGITVVHFSPTLKASNIDV